jgi:hypothetical protein
MNAELRKLKTFQELSRETNAFSAELWIDGKIAAYVENDGGGGSHMIRYVDRSHGKSAFEDAFNAWTKAMPPIPDDGYGPLEMDAELWIGEEMERIAWEQQLKRRCSRNTLIRLEGDSADEYRTFKPAMKFTPDLAAKLRAKHGANLIEIINERFIKGAK